MTGIMTRKDLRELSRFRLQEAEALYKAHLYDGCIYLAGYAVELALRARICRLLRVKEYPLSGNIGKAFKVHKLDQLKQNPRAIVFDPVSRLVFAASEAPEQKNHRPWYRQSNICGKASSKTCHFRRSCSRTSWSIEQAVADSSWSERSPAGGRDRHGYRRR